MQEKTSVKGNIIKFERKTLQQDISEIIEQRFGDKDFLLESSLDDLHDPHLLADMNKAIKRLKEAKEKEQKVIIFGDYDVDGVTSTSILMHFFTSIGIKSSYRIPHREKDGYGLKSYFIDELSEIGVDLIITVDCGIRDSEIITYAKEKNVDIIVTDHHSIAECIPKDAVAVINPKRKDCKYPFKDLAGVGVAFKLIQAMVFDFKDENSAQKYLQETIDIVAIGTVADCMKLTGENRVIVQNGLKQIKNSRSIGIRRLIEDKINDDLDADIFGFQIGPKLNAAGRMDSPYKAVNLILNNSVTVNRILSEIEKLNELRKFKTKEFTTDALNKINKNDNLIFYVSPAIDHGIIGIVAGRITEQFNKPCICLKDEGEKLVASCRSPEYFSIIEILEKYKSYFLAFGGHAQAAGFSISKEKFSEFKTKILTEVNKLDFSKNKKEIKIDKVVRLEELGFSFLGKVNKYKPFGIGNQKPLFMIENLEYEKMEFLGKTRDHLKFTTKHGFKIFAFYMGDFYEEIKRNGGKINLIFDVSEDSWMGRKNLMLKVVDIVLI